MELANGEYVAFLDSDDILVDEDSLKEMYDFALKENLDMVSANLFFVDKDYVLKKDNHHYRNNDYCYFDDYCIIHPKEYGIPYGFTKAIFNFDFLKTNNIQFPDYPTGEDPIFLALVFANLSRMGGVPLTMYGYNHSVGGGVNKKINTYQKKRYYVNHFKIVCDILESADLFDLSNDYKNHLFRYLIWHKNFFDFDLMRIFSEIYGEVDENYFDKTDNGYLEFLIHYRCYYLYHSNSNEFFNTVKKELLSLNIYSIPKIQSETLHKYVLITGSDSYDEFKCKYESVRMEKLQVEHESLKQSILKLNAKQEKLINKCNKQKELNDSLLQSSSWKLTEPLRKIMKSK